MEYQETLNIKKKKKKFLKKNKVRGFTLPDTKLTTKLQ